MDTLIKKEAILSAISEELDMWLSKESSITDGYEYETEFMKTARQINRILLSKSIGESCSNRNKKNSTRILGNMK